MKVLVITGDLSFGPGHPRYELQRSVADRLEVVYLGRWKVIPRIPKGPFDVVTAQDPFLRGHLAAHLAWWYGAKLNLQVHTDLSAYSPRRRAWAGFNLRKASSVRVVSNTLKEQVVALGVKAPIFVLPIFVDVAPFRALVAKPHVQQTILWMGRFEAEKDPVAAVDVLQDLHVRGVQAKLVMLGVGSLGSTLRGYASSLPVEFPGWQDPKSFLETADVVLCTSRHESWGASIVEALAAGVPVVAPDIGIARDAGAIVVPRAELATAVEKVLQSGARGTLRIQLLSSSEWAQAWKASLA